MRKLVDNLRRTSISDDRAPKRLSSKIPTMIAVTTIDINHKENSRKFGMNGLTYLFVKVEHS